MIKYYEVCSDIGTTKRNLIIKKDEFVNYIDPLKDCYRSLFYFDEAIVEHVKQKGTVAGFRDKAGIERLVFDFDNSDLEKAQADVISFVNFLIQEFTLKEDEIAVYFSGRKGFAIELLTKGLHEFENINEKIPLYTKKCCITLAQHLSSFDRVIYNLTRIYRICNTRHQKASKLGGIEAQLFKIQLTNEQLKLPIEEIKKLATKPRLEWEINSISNPIKLNELFQNIWASLSSYNTKIENGAKSNVKQVQYNGCPKNQKYCIWLLEQGAYTENRDNALLILASNDRKQGMQKEVIRAKLFGILDLMNQNNPEKAKFDPITDTDMERIINQAFNNDYGHKCNHPILSSICNEKCYLYKAKENMSKAGTISLLDAYTQSSDFYKNYYENLIQTGIKEIDDNMPIFKGTCNLLVGEKGIGKTSLALNIIKNMAKFKTPTLFFNLDMSEELCIAKLGSIILADLAGKPVISANDFMIAHTKQKFNGEFKQALENLSKWVSISSKRSMSIQDIMKELDHQEKVLNKKFKLIIIDHVQLLASASKNEYERHTQNASLFSELAKNNKIGVLGLSHSVIGENGRLLAKGSRNWEAEAHTQINCYRLFQHVMSEQDRYMTLQQEKNRFGKTDTSDIYFDGASSWVRELTEEEKTELIGLKEQLREKSKKYGK